MKEISDRTGLYLSELGNDGKTEGGRGKSPCMLQPELKAIMIWALVSMQSYLYLYFPEAWKQFSYTTQGVVYGILPRVE